MRLPAFLALALALAGLSACSASDGPGTGASSDDAQRDDDDSSPDAGERDDTGKRDASRPEPTDDDEDDEDDDEADERDDEDLEACAAIRQDAPPAKGAVDIVFIIDTSLSMAHALTQVQMNMAKFVQSFESTSADTRVVVITALDPAAGTPLASDSARYKFILSPIDSKALFTIALARFNDYKAFLRPEAVTQFVMVTDDNDIVPPPQFKQAMEEQLGRSFVQHAIASESVNGLPCVSEAQLANPLCAAPIPLICAAAAVGEAYYSLADQTGGTKMSICKADWTSVFDQLQEAVVSAVPLPCDYPLPDAASADFDPDNVSIVYEGADKREEDFPKAMTSDRCGDDLGWHYDDNDAPTSIKLCPAACTKVQKGGSIDIALGCPPPVLL